MEEGQPGSPKAPTGQEIRLPGHFHDGAFQERNPTGYRKLVTLVMRDDFTGGIIWNTKITCSISSEKPGMEEF